MASTFNLTPKLTRLKKKKEEGKINIFFFFFWFEWKIAVFRPWNRDGHDIFYCNKNPFHTYFLFTQHVYTYTSEWSNGAQTDR